MKRNPMVVDDSYVPKDFKKFWEEQLGNDEKLEEELKEEIEKEAPSES